MVQHRNLPHHFPDFGELEVRHGHLLVRLDGAEQGVEDGHVLCGEKKGAIVCEQNKWKTRDAEKAKRGGKNRLRELDVPVPLVGLCRERLFGGCRSNLGF